MPKEPSMTNVEQTNPSFYKMIVYAKKTVHSEKRSQSGKKKVSLPTWTSKHSKTKLIKSTLLTFSLRKS